MVARLNVVVLLVSAVLTYFLYVRSVSPAALEKEIGPDAYRICGRYRQAAAAMMGVAVINYVLYAFYPLPLSLPRTFPWGYGVSALLALLIGVPSGYLMIVGVRDAGSETWAPRKETKLYKGIYEYIRHPQAIGELLLWWVLALLLHSPFLVLASLIWLPVWYGMMRAEEVDLLLRFGADYAAYLERTGAVFPRWRS